jgi:hypothetical protein
MLSRLGGGASVCVGMDSDGDWSATHYVGSEPTYSMTGGTLAEALSALLVEIPPVQRPTASGCSDCRAPRCECGDSAGWEAS